MTTFAGTRSAQILSSDDSLTDSPVGAGLAPHPLDAGNRLI